MLAPPMLRLYDVILTMATDLKPVMIRIGEADPDLARQMRRATCSVALNTAEGMYRGGRNKKARYQNALGSMRETMACVEIGMALGYVDAIDDGLVDRVRRVIGTLANLVR